MRALRALVLIALAAAGCDFDVGGGAGQDRVDAGSGAADAAGGDVDAGSQADAGGCPDLLPFEPSNFSECELDLIPEDLVLDVPGVYLLDTDTGVLVDPDGGTRTLEGVVLAQTDAPDIFAVTFQSFTLDTASGLSAHGTRAFALVTTGGLVVAGAMGVPATGSVDGAGGDDVIACRPGGRGTTGELHADPDGNLAGGAGGGGGGFASVGGLGGGVDGAEDDGPTDGGNANGNGSLVPLRGGCSGGRAGEAGVSGGPGGGAGGALQLVAGARIEVGGYVTARGGGGRGVIGPSGGGGGGGSGGGLLFEAVDIVIDGAVTANGGGGGEGGRTTGASDDGTNGHDQDDQRASGGAFLSFGGDGGAGGALDADAGGDGSLGSSNPEALAGGGGGGGSVGRIHLRAIDDLAIDVLATISPAPQ